MTLRRRARVELAGARGAQAHLWGARHANSWGWAHAADLETLGGHAGRRRLARQHLDHRAAPGPRGRPDDVGRRAAARRAVQRHEPGAGAALEGRARGLTSYRVSAAPAHPPRRARGRRRPRGARRRRLRRPGRRAGCAAGTARSPTCAATSGTARAAGSAAGTCARRWSRRSARCFEYAQRDADRRAADAHRRMTPLPPLPEPFALARRADRGRPAGRARALHDALAGARARRST